MYFEKSKKTKVSVIVLLESARNSIANYLKCVSESGLNQFFIEFNHIKAAGRLPVTWYDLVSRLSAANQNNREMLALDQQLCDQQIINGMIISINASALKAIQLSSVFNDVMVLHEGLTSYISEHEKILSMGINFFAPNEYPRGYELMAGLDRILLGLSGLSFMCGVLLSVMSAFSSNEAEKKSFPFLELAIILILIKAFANITQFFSMRQCKDELVEMKNVLFSGIDLAVMKEMSECELPHFVPMTTLNAVSMFNYGRRLSLEQPRQRERSPIRPAYSAT